MTLFSQALKCRLGFHVGKWYITGTGNRNEGNSKVGFYVRNIRSCECCGYTSVKVSKC